MAHKAWWMDHTDFSAVTPLLHKYGEAALLLVLLALLVPLPLCRCQCVTVRDMVAGVDLFLAGHVHNYQRTLPYLGDDVDMQADSGHYVNPKYMTTLIVGSPGALDMCAAAAGGCASDGLNAQAAGSTLISLKLQ